MIYKSLITLTLLIVLTYVDAGDIADSSFPPQGYQKSFDRTQSDKEVLDLLTHKNR